jgi:hypothetical protein
MIIRRAEAMIEKLMSANGLIGLPTSRFAADPNWTYEITNRSLGGTYRHGASAAGAIGVCSPAAKQLRFKKDFIYNSSPRKVEQLIIHEIAHALTPNPGGHSIEWQNKARELGYTWRLHYEEAAEQDFMSFGKVRLRTKLKQFEPAPWEYSLIGAIVGVTVAVTSLRRP